MGKESAEEKGRAKLYRIIKSAVAVFATFFIVIGVVIVAFLARDTASEVNINDVKETENIKQKISVFLLVKEDGASIYQIDGTFLRNLTWPEDTKILQIPLSQLKGVNLDNGRDVWLDPGFVKATSTWFRSSDGRREAFIGSVRRDGSFPLIVKYGNQQESRVLRVDGNKLLKDVMPIGFLNEKSFVVMGNATGTLALYEIFLGGGYDYIAPITEGMTDCRIAQGEIFCVKTGLRKDVKERNPPEQIWKIDKNHQFVAITEEVDMVIQSFIYENGVLAYSLADRSLVVENASKKVKIGYGLPLMVLPDGSLLYSDEQKVFLRSKDDAGKKIFDEGDYYLFYLENVLVDDDGTNSIN
jgi:hypothetical protein